MTTKDSFKAAYSRAKADAKRRGIEFLFCFDDWKNWWVNTALWHLRGRNAGCYQMCRINDIGPYSVENVYCDTIEANSKLPHKGTKRPDEWKNKISIALSGASKSENHRKSLASNKLGKKYVTPAGVFITSAECEAATGVKRATVMWRCKNNYLNQWSYAA